MRTFKPVKGLKSLLPTYKFLSLLLIPSFFVIYSASLSYIEVLIFLIFTYGLITLMLVIAQKTTSYQIDNNNIYYKSFLITKGKIEIATIYKIKLNSESWQNGMPATTNKGGISIFYNKFDEIYLSPENNQYFVEEILKIKPDIEILYIH